MCQKQFVSETVRMKFNIRKANGVARDNNGNVEASIFFRAALYRPALWNINENEITTVEKMLLAGEGYLSEYASPPI